MPVSLPVWPRRIVIRWAATGNFSSSFFPLMKSCHLTAHLMAAAPLPCACAGRQAGRPSIVIAQVVRVVRHRAGAGHGHRLRRRDDSVAPLPAGPPACPMACPYALGTPGGGGGVGGGVHPGLVHQVPSNAPGGVDLPSDLLYRLSHSRSNSTLTVQKRPRHCHTLNRRSLPGLVTNTILDLSKLD